MANNDEALALQILKGRYCWETWIECQAACRKYSKHWEPPKSGQTKNQCLRKVRKCLYMKDVYRKAHNRHVNKATEKKKNGDFKTKELIYIIFI